MSEKAGMADIEIEERHETSADKGMLLAGESPRPEVPIEETSAEGITGTNVIVDQQ